MIVSTYNFHVIKGNDALFYNAFSGVCRYLSRQTFEQINTALQCLPDSRTFQELPPNTQAWLIHGKFITDSLSQEREEVLCRQAVSKKADDVLALTIVPTLACNLRCPYCYQSHENSRMGPNDLAKLDRFVKHWIHKHECRRLKVCWYGGEPLLALNIIRQATGLLVKHCQNTGMGYSASMVTNGTLLTPEYAQELLGLGINQYQITLDGLKDVHDPRRPFSSGQGSSFDIIMQNLKYMIGRVSIDLRANTDQSNWRSVIKLVETLGNKGWLKSENKLSIYLSPVERVNEYCNASVRNLFTQEEFSSIEETFMEQLLRYAPHLLAHAPAPRSISCSAATEWSFIVMPGFKLIKCWSHVGVDTLKKHSATLPIINRVKDKQCIKCDVLPICMGGCSYYRTTRNANKMRCETLKYNLQNRLDFVLRARKKLLILKQATQMCKLFEFSEEEGNALAKIIMARC